jgi:hypothetical protein
MAERLWDYHGVDITEEHQPLLNRYFRNIRREGIETFPEELEKTPADIALLRAINGYLRQEFINLGLTYTPFKGRQFHFFDEEGINRNIPNHSEDAFRTKTTDYVVVQKDAWDEAAFPLVLIHQAVRFKEYRAYHAHAALMRVTEERSGYVNQNPHEKEHEHYLGFDSAVSQKLAREIFLSRLSHLSRITGVELTGQLDTAFSSDYDMALQILDTIITRVSGHLQLSPEEVWQGYKRALFTGNLFHLRAIEKAFGDGSLRVLAAWESATIYAQDAVIEQQILQYFKTDDVNQRHSIALNILNERERLRYMKQYR